MKKLRLNTEEKSVILEMHKKVGYKSMVNETMDITDIDKDTQLDKLMKDLVISPQDVNEIKSKGEDKLLDEIGCIPEEFNNIRTIEDAKKLYKETVNSLNEQDLKLGEDDKKYIMAMAGLLLLGIITAIVNRASDIAKFFKRLFAKKPKCARRR